MQEPELMDILRKAWDNYKHNAKLLTLVATFGAAIPLIAYTVYSYYIQISVSLNSSHIGASTHSSFGIVNLAILIVLVIILYATKVGLINISFKILKNEQISYKDAFLANDTLVELFKAGIFVGFLTFLGTIFCIIPGIIISFLFSLVPFILLFDSRKTIGESLTASRKLMTKYIKVTLLITLIEFAITTIAGATVVGVIISMPLTIMIDAVLLTTLAEIENSNDKANNILR